MDRRWISRAWAMVAIAATLSANAVLLAAPPWEKLLSFKRVEAEPGKVYRITEDNGPWMIIACSFSGDGAQEQAVELTFELRKKYKLEAYVHAMRFDIGETLGRGVDRFGGAVKMKPQRGAELQEIAVLVGNYPAIDTQEAQETLQKIKFMRPECLTLREGKKTNASLAGLRTIQQQVLPDNNEKKRKGPMGHAFVTTNPLLPKEYFAPRGLDDLVVKMNEKVEHSLLSCPGRYTVQVAHFTGKVVLDQKEINAITNGTKEMKSHLAEAADKAHRMTVALRRKGYEAYEFHDRYASIVTVGSFNAVGAPRPDGKIEIDPQIHSLIKTFSAEPGPDGQIQPKHITEGKKRIPFDIQPIPVEVPRRSIAATLSRDRTARR